MSERTSLDNVYCPDVVSCPGETIRELMRDFDISLEQLANTLGLSLQRAQELLRGAVLLTPPIANKLQHLLGPPSVYWLRHEKYYRYSLRKLNVTDPRAPEAKEK